MTGDDVLDGLSPTISGTVEWRVVDETGAVAGNVSPARRARITNTTTRKVKRSAQNFWLSSSERADLNVFSDRLDPVFLIDVPGVDEPYEYPLGRFRFADANDLRRAGFDGDDLDLEGTLVDETIVLDAGLEESISYPTGTNLGTIAAETYERFGFSDPRIDTTGRTLSAPATWAGGRDSAADLLVEISRQAGWYEPYFDNAGRPTLRAAALDPDTVAADVEYRSGRTIVRDSIVESRNLLDAYNVFLAVDSSASASPIVGRYEIPADEENSVPNLNYVIPRRVEIQGLSSTEAARDAAQLEALSTAGSYRPVKISTLPDPRRDTYEIADYLGALYRIVSWDLDATIPGQMDLDLRIFYR